MKEINETARNVKQVPGPFALPFFGTMFSRYQLRGKDLYRCCEEQLKLFGPVVKHEYYWNVPIVVLYAAEDIGKVLRADKMSFRPPIQLSLMARDSLPEYYIHTGLTDPATGIGRHLRAMVHSITLPHKNVAEYLPVIDEITSDLVNKLGAQEGAVNLLLQILEEYTWDVACYHTLGIKTKMVAGSRNPLWEEFLQLQKAYWLYLAKSYQQFPFWQYFSTPLWKRYRALEARNWEITSQMIKDLDGDTNALLPQLCLQESMSFEEKAVLTADFLMASMHPVSNSLYFTLYQIAKLPQVQAKLRQELKTLLPDRNTKLTKELVDKMDYLQAVVKECFRLNPTTPNLARVLETDTEVRGYKIPAGTPILCQTWFACLQEENFARPKEFLPERWITAQARHYKPCKHHLMTHFGHGKQMCPGRVMATQVLHVAVAKVFRAFEITCEDELTTEYDLLRAPMDTMAFGFRPVDD